MVNSPGFSRVLQNVKVDAYAATEDVKGKDDKKLTTHEENFVKRLGRAITARRLKNVFMAGLFVRKVV